MNLLNYNNKLIILSFIDPFESQNLRFSCKEWFLMPKESLFDTKFYKKLINLKLIVEKDLKLALLSDNLDVPYEIQISNILLLNKMYNQLPVSISIDQKFRKKIEKFCIEKRPFFLL